MPPVHTDNLGRPYSHWKPCEESQMRQYKDTLRGQGYHTSISERYAYGGSFVLSWWKPPTSDAVQ